MIRYVAAASMALLVSAPGLAQEGFYVKGGIGYGVPTEMDVNQLPGVPDAEVTGEGDFRGMVGFGYDFGNNWRLDVDAVDRYSDLGAVNEVYGSGDWQNIAIMGNAIYELADVGGLSPYLGGGVGVALNNLSLEGVPAPAVDVSGDESTIALQGLAGVAMDLSQRLSADLEYRYFYGGDGDIDGVSFNQLDSHDLLVGLRYSFGRTAAAPAAAPAPAPAPAPPTERAAPPVVVPDCDDIEFVVYFELNSSDLTSQAEDVVDNAAGRVGECDTNRVVVTGHTDRSGSSDYNQQLSERRARVVREALIRQGVMASQITVQASGETDLAVDTPDGVREPLNRRSEVVIYLEFTS